MLAIALATLALAAAAPAPPTLLRYHPSASSSFCLSGIDSGFCSVDGCGLGFQNFELSGGQLRQTEGGYHMCIFPEREWNGAKVKGAICTDAHSHWAPGPKPGTIAWKGFWCLDNASGKAEDGGRVEIWKCTTSYVNKNQLWSTTPAPKNDW